MKYEIGSEKFATKIAIKTRAQKILWDASGGTFLRDQDFVFMRALLDRHPDAAQKIGVGVAQIQVIGDGHSRGFLLYRTDQTVDNFSYKECISPASHRQKVMKAFRNAIIDQIETARAEAFSESYEIMCPIKGILIERDDAAVDHEPPRTFAFLVEDFCRVRGLIVNDVKIWNGPEGWAGKHLLEPLYSEWYAYHAENARLRVISAIANDEIARQARSQSRKSP